MKNKIRTLALILSLIFPLPAGAAGVSVEDTVAGLGAVIQVSGSTNAEVVVIPPYGSEIVKKAGTDGRAEISGQDTEMAGNYQVEVYENGDLEATSSFEVLPDTLDPYASSLQSDYPALEPDGRDVIQVTAILRDKYSNPLPGRPVELISSRTSDTITSLSNETDFDGAQVFEVATFEQGEMTLRAMDMISGKLVEDVLEIQAGGNSVGGYFPEPAYQPQAYPPAYNYNPYPPYNLNPTSEVRLPAIAQRAKAGRPTFSGRSATANILGRQFYGQTASFDVVNSFRVEVSDELDANEDTTIRITAIDENGLRVEDYTGAVFLSSTDPNALLPLEGRIQFDPQNLGEKVLTLGLRFRTAGEQILHVEDSTDPNINTQAYINVLGEGGETVPTLNITSHKQSQIISDEEITLEGAGSPFINLIVTGGTRDVRGETDQHGVFSIPVALNEELNDHTIRVKDDTGRFDSGNIHLILDKEPPEIGTITFNPVEPEAKQTVDLAIETTGKATRVTAQIDEKEFELIESETASGTFALSFSAPEPGTHQPVIKAYDEAGNETEIRSNIVVKIPGLPQVQNVAVEQLPDGSVSLAWNPVEEARVDAYRIYVGEDPNDFLYTLDTDQATTTASVAGLNPKSTYYFAVTALQGNRESELKSEVAEIATEGFALAITPQDGSLLIEWDNPPQHSALSAYVLEYGADPNALTEQRTISGDLNAFSLRDLIDGINYYVKLTPVSLTGEVLHEIAADGSGSPIGSAIAFTPTPAHAVPDEILAAASPPPGFMPPAPSTDLAPDEIQPQSFHSGAPATPKTGLPFWVWICIGITAIFLYMHWHRQRTIKMTMEFMKSMEDNYRKDG